MSGDAYGLSPDSEYADISGSPYCFDVSYRDWLSELAARVNQMRASGQLSGEALRRINKFFRLKNIYNSNAIEGNQLNLGETRMVIEQGLTITGKPLKDSAEARNLGDALDYFEELASTHEPLTCNDIRQVHSLILKDIDNDHAGRYRTINVQISGSSYNPPGPESVPGQMDDLCAWLIKMTDQDQTSPLSENPVLIAAAAHSWFVSIHPFVDGNGRTARLLMNLILMRYGYPIAVITKDDRQRYYDALEESQSSNLTPFISLLTESINEGLEEYERAVAEQTAQHEWAQSLVARFTEPERVEASNYYEVWRSSMDLFRGYVKQSIDLINDQAQGLARIYLTDFGTLEFEKYLSLRNGQSTKRTWFFRVDFRSNKRRERFLFFFGFASPQLWPSLQVGDRVTLYVATEMSPFFYERLDNITRPNLPDLREVAYNAKSEQFLARLVGDITQPARVESIVQNFFSQVVQRNFAE